MIQKQNRRITAGMLLVAITVWAFHLYLPTIPVAHAASLTALSDTMSSSKVSTLSSHVLKFTTPTGASDNTDTIIITFPSDFSFASKTIGTVSFTHGATTGAESTETLAASPSATAWGAVFSGTNNRVLTLTAPTDGVGAATVAASDKIIITYTSANSTNATTNNTQYDITISGTFGDTGTISVYLITDDQVAVSATVNQTLSFSLSANTISFGTLTSANARYADTSTGGTSETQAHTVIASTNSSSGYIITVKGATLTSGANTITAIGASNTASAAGTEQFGLRMTASGGTGTVTAPYAAAGFAYAADGSTTSQVASATGASAATTYSARYLANITSTTEAGSYTATLTYTDTATF
jgi:hypothetical protein